MITKTKQKLFISIGLSLVITFFITNFVFLHNIFSDFFVLDKTKQAPDSISTYETPMPTEDLITKETDNSPINPSSTIIPTNTKISPIITSTYPTTKPILTITQVNTDNSDYNEITMTINNIPTLVYFPKNIIAPTEEQLIQMEKGPISLPLDMIIY